jgi:hypothetical protein
MSGKDGTLPVRVAMKKDIKSNMNRHVAGFSTSNWTYFASRCRLADARMGQRHPVLCQDKA